jgi:hypothetical protein
MPGPRLHYCPLTEKTVNYSDLNQRRQDGYEQTGRTRLVIDEQVQFAKSLQHRCKGNLQIDEASRNLTKKASEMISKHYMNENCDTLLFFTEFFSPSASNRCSAAQPVDATLGLLQSGNSISEMFMIFRHVQQYDHWK